MSGHWQLALCRMRFPSHFSPLPPAGEVDAVEAASGERTWSMTPPLRCAQHLAREVGEETYVKRLKLCAGALASGSVSSKRKPVASRAQGTRRPLASCMA